MARAAKSTALTEATTSKSIAAIDDELSKEVASLKGQISQGSGNKIKIEATGDFVLPDGMNLGNEIQVVVLDFISRNNFYTVPFDPQNPAVPDCYAMGRVLADMAPENDAPDPQSDKCITCPLNQFGSGNGGRGKACANRRLLAVLLVDPDKHESHNAPDAPIYTMDLSPSNIKSFDGAVNAVARALNGPPIKAILTVTGRNVGTYATVSFIDPVPNPDYAAHAARRPECQDLLTRRPDFAAYAAKPAAPAHGRAPARGAARAAAGGRR